jgi:hypothetical protein
MFNPPCKLDHLTELFQSLCDATMDLDPKALVEKIPENLLECAHLVVLADVSVVRECASVAEQLSNAEPYQIVNLVVEHHKKITHYLFIRSIILDGDPADDLDDFDLKIF